MSRSGVRVPPETPWGISTVGRAPALQAGSQEFESPILHGTSVPLIPCSSAVELRSVKPSVPGSNPGGGALPK